jgi:ribosomal protein L37E
VLGLKSLSLRRWISKSGASNSAGLLPPIVTGSAGSLDGLANPGRRRQHNPHEQCTDAGKQNYLIENCSHCGFPRPGSPARHRIAGEHRGQKVTMNG